jgi:hypothetical protein
MNKVFESYVRLEHTSHKTDKTYKKWHFTGWAILPNLDAVKWYRKADWLIVVKEDGTLDRYRTGKEFEEGLER